MATHKAPTAVTIAPLSESSPFETAVQRFWLPLTVLLMVVVGGILLRHNMQRRALQAREASWEAVSPVLKPQGFMGLPGGSPEALAGAAEQARGTDAGPWARLLQVRAMADARRYDEALQVLDQLEREAPDHPLSKEPHDLPAGSSTVTKTMRQALLDMKAWEAANPQIFGFPELAPDAPRVRVQTDKGDFVLGLYPDQAPDHVASFLRLAREGAYDGTRFHGSGGAFIQAGDPKSKDLDQPETWGQEDESSQVATVENDLAHFAGALAAARAPGAAKESGVQFIVTYAAAHHLDGSQTVFGRVVEGLDVVSAIAGQPMAENSERPLEPAVIERVEVL